MTHNRNIRHLIVFTFFALILAGAATLWPSGQEKSEIPDHLLYVVATATTENLATTTTLEPEPAPTVVTTTTTAAPTTTTTTAAPTPAVPQAPPCSTWASQEEVDAWMAANAASHDTSNIDTNGDGVACTLSFVEPAPQVAAQPQTQTQGGYVGGFLECVKQRESRGDYTAVNSSSGAGGAYQFLQSTWNNTANHIGRPDLVGLHPSSADPATQDMMAQALLSWQGTSPWAYPASPC